jgi:hypothetical protein
MTKEASKIVAREETMPCGCVEREFSDKRVEVMACPPHALAEAGRHLHNAGQMLNAAAQRLLREQAALSQASILRESK